jgi:hypothetical protein
MKSAYIQPSVRLPPELHRQLRAAAVANNATLNGEIVRRLEASLQLETLEAHFDAFARQLLATLAERTNG